MSSAGHLWRRDTEGRKKAAAVREMVNRSTFAMKFVLFCAFAATFAALAICAPSLSVSAHLLSADEVAMLESDETLSVEQSSIFCPLDFKTNGLSSIGAAEKIHEQAMANAHCSIAKAKTSIATIKYNHDVSLFKQNNQRTTWRTQAQVDQAKNVLDAAKADENRKCLCKTGGSTEADAAKARTEQTVSGFTRSEVDFSRGTYMAENPDNEYCPGDFPDVPHSQNPSSDPRKAAKDRREVDRMNRRIDRGQRNANRECRNALSGPRYAQKQYNEAFDKWANPTYKYKPSQATMTKLRDDLAKAVAAMEEECDCHDVEKEKARIKAEETAVRQAQTQAEAAVVAEVKAAENSKDAAEAKAQTDGYSSVQGKIDAWSKATTEARDAAKKAASTKAAEVAQRNAQAIADSKAKTAASSKASEQAKADAKTKAISQAKAEAEAKAAAEAQAAADKAAADVWRTELATATITASSSATVTSAATATASGQGTASATESASGSAAVAKAGASETASVTESVTESKTATATATAEASATESAEQSATATKTAPGTKVHFSCKA